MANNCPRDTPDLRIARIERRQHGPIHHRQLRDEVKLTQRQIRHRIEVRRLRRVFPEVYVVGLRELDALGSWSAAVLACGEGAALGCRSGGQFHRIHDHYDGWPEVYVTRENAPRIRGIRARTATFGPYDVITRDNVRVTSLPRTLLDLAGVLTADELSQAFQRALALRVRLAHVEDVIARNPRAKGRRTLTRLIERHRNDKGVGRGDFENAFYTWLKSWLPKRFKVARNVKVPFGDGVTREADLLIDNAVWVEVDFHGHHAGAGPEKATKDLQRDRIVGKHYKLGRYTDWEFTHDPAAIRAHLEELLGLGAYQARTTR